MNSKVIIIVGLVALLTLFVIVFLLKGKKKSKGIITDAVVVNVDVVRDKETGIVSYFPYVQFIGLDKQVHTAMLNSNINPMVGKVLKIKYNPVQYEYAILISREEE